MIKKVIRRRKEAPAKVKTEEQKQPVVEQAPVSNPTPPNGKRAPTLAEINALVSDADRKELDALYSKSPMERFNALPDYSQTLSPKAFSNIVAHFQAMKHAHLKYILAKSTKNMSLCEIQLSLISKDSIDEKNRERAMTAVEYLNDRAFGKATQRSEISGLEGGTVHQRTVGLLEDMDKFTEEQIDEMLKAEGIVDESDDHGQS